MNLILEKLRLERFFPNDKHSDILSVIFSFIVTGLLIRGYEIFFITSGQQTHSSYISEALISDFLLFSLWGFIFLLLSSVLFQISKKYSLVIIKTLIGLFILTYVGTLQYFGEVFVLLGADFWAYNLTELNDTIQTSVSFSLIQILPYVLFLSFFFLLIKLLNRRRFNNTTFQYSVLVLAAASLLNFTFNPTPDDYETEIDYALSVNKATHFWSQSATHILTGWFTESYEGEEYPLSRTPHTNNTLGSYFKESNRNPNLVFVLVEGLGGTFMPPNASYPGFTPFLDSLAQKSLYWTHFLSTSGRSFNAQPSIFGSLPYGNSGFMDLEYEMPYHHSLISILNENGYKTNYFGGYDTRFDNLDQFLERQKLNLLINSSDFPENYQKMDEIEGGFSWGYSDHDLYNFAFSKIQDFPPSQPRLDIFFTLNLHEPFIIPNSDYYQNEFEQRLSQLENTTDIQQNGYLNNRDLFEALLYTDDSIRELIDMYRSRPDFVNTLFIITGDHRTVPVPHRDKIDRYYVPFMIYSPLLTSSQQFKGVSSHLDVTPTLLSLLSSTYYVEQPEFVHWLGDSLSTSTSFVSNKKIPLMRIKNQLVDYISGQYFLSQNQLYRLNEAMEVNEIQDKAVEDQLKEEFSQFKLLNKYVTENNKLLRLTETQQADRDILTADLNFLREQELLSLNESELFSKAQTFAFNQDYKSARIILRQILRRAPGFHDARLLYGRTFAWNGEYQRAEKIFMETLKRAPEYDDTYVAFSDLYYWQQNLNKSLHYADIGLKDHPDNPELLFRKARGFYVTGATDSAQSLIQKGLSLYPDNEKILQLRSKISAINN